mmetsp:Transcript_4410/g.13805  ORF Transcript_4410/g.13805 Transcript_4410/m.13805 type:complete len:321 (+) Transcript_4410:302-1264(+)
MELGRGRGRGHEARVRAGGGRRLQRVARRAVALRSATPRAAPRALCERSALRKPAAFRTHAPGLRLPRRDAAPHRQRRAAGREAGGTTRDVPARRAGDPSLDDHRPGRPGRRRAGRLRVARRRGVGGLRGAFGARHASPGPRNGHGRRRARARAYRELRLPLRRVPRSRGPQRRTVWPDERRGPGRPLGVLGLGSFGPRRRRRPRRRADSYVGRPRSPRRAARSSLPQRRRRLPHGRALRSARRSGLPLRHAPLPAHRHRTNDPAATSPIVPPLPPRRRAPPRRPRRRPRPRRRSRPHLGPRTRRSCRRGRRAREEGRIF